MSDLWASKREQSRKSVEPLAVRMRPRALDEFAGQLHILGPGKLLRRMLSADTVTSMIFHGPPGTGKTTLAELIAKHTKRAFVRENAALVGVKRIRDVIDEATRRLELENKRTILFLDEIHRFTKSQQDVLLTDVERGLITLIGATTENPLFAVNSALVSRSTLFRLETLSEDDITAVLKRAITDKERGFGNLNLQVTDDALKVWSIKCDGDARRALGALEVAVESQRIADRHSAFDIRHSTQASADTQRDIDTSTTNAEPRMPNAAILIDSAIAQDSIQQKAALYDASGDQHYDHASALIKSVRGSDPDAAIYWLARMLDAGEDPRFIARRLAILASEDIGNADPRAIMIAASCFSIVERIGMPEARITLAQTTTYLALAPKSNASYTAIDEAMKDVAEGRTIPVPVHIKDSNVRKATDISISKSPSREASGVRVGGVGVGESPRDQDYKYTHTDGTPDPHLGMIGTQQYLGVDKHYYNPTTHGSEKLLKEALDRARALRETTPD